MSGEVVMARPVATAQEWTPAEEAELARGELPRGARLVAIRTELVELCRLHAPGSLAEAQRSLLAALPRRMTQLELFPEVA